MAKYPVQFQKGDDLLKRSVTLEAMELLFITCSKMTVRRLKRKTCKITFAFVNDNLLSVATVYDVPHWVAKRFRKEEQWEERAPSDGPKKRPDGHRFVTKYGKK